MLFMFQILEVIQLGLNDTDAPQYSRLELQHYMLHFLLQFSLCYSI